MNWDAVGAIAESLGAIAVVATLIYLAREIRVNTAAISRSATQSILASRTENAKFLAADPATSEFFLHALEEPDGLTKAEWRRFSFLAGGMIRPVELAYLDYRDGRMEEKLWTSQLGFLRSWLTMPGAQRWLPGMEAGMHEDFFDFLRSEGLLTTPADDDRVSREATRSVGREE